MCLCRCRTGTKTKSILKIAKIRMRPLPVAFSFFLRVCSAQRAAHIGYALVLTLMIRFGFEHVKIFSPCFVFPIPLRRCRRLRHVDVLPDASQLFGKYFDFLIRR